MIGNAKKPNLKDEDKLIVLDLKKFSFFDMPSLLKMSSMSPENVKDDALDSRTKKLLGMDASEMKKYDKIKICLDTTVLNVVKQATRMQAGKLDYDVFDCSGE